MSSRALFTVLHAAGGETALHLACRRGHASVAEALLASGARCDQGDWTALHSACRNGDLEMLRLLLEGGAALNRVCEGGWTPLLIAAHNGHLELVQLLLDAKADKDQASENKVWTPLQIATAGGHLEIARLLQFHQRDGEPEPKRLKRWFLEGLRCSFSRCQACGATRTPEAR